MLGDWVLRKISKFSRRYGTFAILDKIEGSQVLNSIPNTRLILVGGGPYESELKQYFKDVDVIFTGPKEGSLTIYASDWCFRSRIE
jgi:hypothetical protein